MVDAPAPATSPARSGLPSQQIFQREWHLYRKVMDNNYLFHDEAYACLRHVLLNEISKPFSFLDVACGDARASLPALRGTAIAHYEGIDLSRAALDMAEQALLDLGCPFILNEGDFSELLPTRREPVDVVWIGLSLHHFLKPDKLRVMRAVRQFVGEGGLFLVYETASPDGEDRDAWLRRWETQRPFWTACDANEWAMIWQHVSTADFPETASTWHAMGREAGFDRVRELFVAPSDLFRLYAFD
jgi:ubiquinone/menaquinone biosynthesis C-methylase UbiE